MVTRKTTVVLAPRASKPPWVALAPVPSRAVRVRVPGAKLTGSSPAASVMATPSMVVEPGR
jgi:hypothetical protein